MKYRNFKVPLGMAIVTALMGVSPAVIADSPVISTPNNGASGKWQSAPDTWNLCDTLTDGRSVYIHAGRTAAEAQSGVRRYENFNGGCINTVAYNLAGNPFWRVCVNIPNNPDNCSAIRSDTR